MRPLTISSTSSPSPRKLALPLFVGLNMARRARDSTDADLWSLLAAAIFCCCFPFSRQYRKRVGCHPAGQIARRACYHRELRLQRHFLLVLSGNSCHDPVGRSAPTLWLCVDVDRIEWRSPQFLFAVLKQVSLDVIYHSGNPYAVGHHPLGRRLGKC
jgi:hypothetical protein